MYTGGGAKVGCPVTVTPPPFTDDVLLDAAVPTPPLAPVAIPGCGRAGAVFGMADGVANCPIRGPPKLNIVIAAKPLILTSTQNFRRAPEFGKRSSWLQHISVVLPS